jgi:hypothetical protein
MRVNGDMNLARHHQEVGCIMGIGKSTRDRIDR